MRQLAFADAAYPLGTPPPGDRGADPRRDDRRLPRCSPAGRSRRPRATGPQGRPPLGALAMSGIEATGPIRGPTGLAPPTWGGFDHSPDARAAAPPTSGRSFRTVGPPRLADGGELDRSDPVLHLLGREARRVGADPRRSCSRSSAAAAGPSTGPSSSSAARCGPSCCPGSPGSPGASSTTASATGC